jgi:hypothetical protein
MRQAVRLLTFLVALLCASGWNAYAQAGPTQAEYKVYEAALGMIDSDPKPDLHVAIYEQTLNSSCGITTDNAVLANGCSFLWTRPETADAVEERLRQRCHGLSHAAWKSFKANNAASVQLHDPLSTPWKHRISGMALPTDEDGSHEWQRPDMTIFLSRVGFDAKNTEALVYVLVFSYSEPAATTGDYLYFRSDSKSGAERQWKLAGRMRYFSGQKDGFVSLHPVPRMNHASTLLQPVAEWK